MIDATRALYKGRASWYDSRNDDERSPMTMIVRIVCAVIVAGGLAILVSNAVIKGRDAHRRGMARVRAFNQEWEANRLEREQYARRAFRDFTE